MSSSRITVTVEGPDELISRLDGLQLHFRPPNNPSHPGPRAESPPSSQTGSSSNEHPRQREPGAGPKAPPHPPSPAPAASRSMPPRSPPPAPTAPRPTPPQSTPPAPGARGEAPQTPDSGEQHGPPPANHASQPTNARDAEGVSADSPSANSASQTDLAPRSGPFWLVTVGLRPGIYDNWLDVIAARGERVHGFRTVYQKWSTLAQAQTQWVWVNQTGRVIDIGAQLSPAVLETIHALPDGLQAPLPPSQPEGNNAPPTSSPSSALPTLRSMGASLPSDAYNFYVVLTGRKVGVFDNWDDVKPQISQYHRANSYGFDTREEAEASLMPRKKTGNAPGRPTALKGSIIPFLQKRMPAYLKLDTDRQKTVFYDRMTRLLFIRYGRDNPLAGDVPEDVPNPDESVLNAVEEFGDETEEEREAREKLRADVRARVAGVYRDARRKLTQGQAPTKQAQNSFVKLISQLVKRPRREQYVHVYQSEFFTTRIEAKFNQEWAKCVAEAGRKAQPLPCRLDVHNRVIRESWEEESETFKNSVHELVETRFREATEEYERTYIEKPKTEEDRAWAIPNAYMFLQPIANLLADRFGMAVSILMAGPVPESSEIDMLSVHSGKTSGVAQEIWPDYDRDGYKATASSMIGFAKAAFPSTPVGPPKRPSGPKRAAASEKEIESEDEDSSERHYAYALPTYSGGYCSKTNYS
ncbi:hypothetical protein BV25DRAFT_1842717 [Artomyces pyxidatus]|uniref:Uncharacterized protein n=1 Tax=Artomyces pyxidatus TaxID=48021 RepID=A0ACB8SIV4_9AGAM|nr:hypothetical protein BV25DRAFT_1842717 [Artomyces pyxidatus]